MNGVLSSCGVIVCVPPSPPNEFEKSLDWCKLRYRAGCEQSIIRRHFKMDIRTTCESSNRDHEHGRQQILREVPLGSQPLTHLRRIIPLGVRETMYKMSPETCPKLINKLSYTPTYSTALVNSVRGSGSPSETVDPAFTNCALRLMGERGWLRETNGYVQSLAGGSLSSLLSYAWDRSWRNREEFAQRVIAG